MNGVMLACTRRAVCRRRVVPSFSIENNYNRWYSSTRPTFDEETAPAAADTAEDKKALRQIALEYGRRKAAYKRNVSKLRKEYMEEYQRHKAEDEAARDAEQAEINRKRLERQRAKNERSVQNAIRQKELRRQAQLAHQDRLLVQQEKREAKAVLRNKARQLCIDELEEEAPMWLTTPEEVDAAFSHEAEQLLWGRPRGVLGAPNPSLDSHYWQYETHTWDMSKTYKTQKELLLEQVEDEAFHRTNIDPDFWTPERIAKHEALETKAKLRANIRSAGRRELLRRQKEYLDEENETKPGDIPKPAPVPSLGVLANIKAQEKEGSELLFKDPTQFFVFDRDQEADDEEVEDVESYSGPSMGAPIGLKDPLRGGDPNGEVFPVGIGKVPKPDTRSEKEKKREEREQKLWAAAQAQAKGADEVDVAADDEMMLGEPIDYDNNTGWDSDDEEWEKGLDPEADADLLAVPRQFRYREDDIEWVLESLKTKAENLQSHVRSTVNALEQDKRAKMQTVSADDEEEDTPSGNFFDEESAAKLQAAGGDVDKFEALMASLSEEQLLSVYGLESKKEKVNVEAGESLFDKIPGLSEEQVAGLTELEKVLHEVEAADSEDVF